MKRLTKLRIDYRIVTQIRTGFMNELIERHGKIPASASLREFSIYLANYHKDLSEEGEALIVKLIKEDQNVSFTKLTQLVDFYTFYPVTVKVDKNNSDNLYLAMTAGREKTSTGKLDLLPLTKAEVHRQKVLEFLWSKIDERFPRLQNAFRFFDKNNNARITFDEFQYAIEGL